MTAAAALDLAAEVADAHASATLAAADHIDVSFSSGGLAFTAKGQPDALACVEARLSPIRQQITLTRTTPRPWTVDVANSEELKRDSRASVHGHGDCDGNPRTLAHSPQPPSGPT